AASSVASPFLTETVSSAATTITLTPSGNTLSPGQAVTFTATVQAVPPGSGTPTGMVTFQDAGVVLGTANIGPTGTASFTATSLASGTHSILATYSGDANFNVSASSPVTVTVTTTPRNAFVIALYLTVLERAPDAPGYNFWVQQLQAGQSRAMIALAFELSTEHRVLEVNQFYKDILHRPSDSGGLTIWVNALLAGHSESEVVVAFLTSPEYMATHADNVSYVAGLYQDLLAHTGDPGGSAYWLDLLKRGIESRAQVAMSFLGSAEAFQQAIDFYYQNYLGRSGDLSGTQGFLDTLQRGHLSSAALGVLFLASDEFLAHANVIAGG
ncbi:MAG TPA: DUF4214 domain-containing protein, partial [Gemmataceae bacterium]|nr:DUF4214 domain-containing protein [Gemmataceae bacterium]